MKEQNNNQEIINVVNKISEDNINGLGNFIAERLKKTLLRKYKKITGKKATLYLKHNDFVIELGDVFVKYKGINTKKGMVLDFLVIHKVKTSRGMIYAIKPNPDSLGVDGYVKALTCYTAHHFDQYALRMNLYDSIHEAIQNRSLVIEHWCLNSDPYSVISYSADNKNIYVPHKFGTSLAINSEDKIILCKTFISNEMLRGRQITEVTKGLEYANDVNDLLAVKTKF